MDRPRLEAGWLGKWDVPEKNHGVFVPRWSTREQAEFPTRREEYWKVAEILDGLPRSYVLDAGAGFNPEIHLMADIMANMGFVVAALDLNQASLVMPPRAGIVRVIGDITNSPNLDATVDYWVCVSTLEHMDYPNKLMALQQAFRVLVPGGVAIMTTDETEPGALNGWLKTAGFEVGPVIPFSGTHLHPRVAYAVARKPGGI